MVTLTEAKEVAAEIADRLHPLLVTLFGTVARKQAGRDLDLLVVVKDADYHGIATDAFLQSILKKYYRKFDIDPFVIPFSKYRQQVRTGEPFLNAIIKEGKVLYMNNHVKEWLRQAQEELNTAEYLSLGQYHRSACYHAEQAIEKFIKAHLIDRGWDLEKTHSIRRLLAIAEEYNLRFNLEEEDVVFIDSIYRGRYPVELGLLPQGDPVEEDSRQAILLATRLLKQQLP